MIKNLAATIPLAVVFSVSFALSTQSVEAKSAVKSSHSAKNYFVPPPPPYTPSMVPSAFLMTSPQAVTAHSAVALEQKPVNFTNPYASDIPGAENKILKDIDFFDSEISSQEKAIDKLLNL